jgi:hypothetical protein
MNTLNSLIITQIVVCSDSYNKNNSGCFRRTFEISLSNLFCLKIARHLHHTITFNDQSQSIQK